MLRSRSSLAIECATDVTAITDIPLLGAPIATSIGTAVEVPREHLHRAFEASDMVPSKTHADVSTRPSTDRERDHLEIGPNSVVLTEERTILNQADRVLGHAVALYAADKYSFSAALLPHISGKTG